MNTLPLKRDNNLFVISDIGPPYALTFNGAISELCDICKVNPARWNVVDKSGYCVAWVCKKSCFNMWTFQKGMDLS